MTFWSSQTLEENLGRLTDRPDRDMVDCNALTLRVGPEVYVTPGLEQASPSTHTRQMLEARGPITVPPGQFAFLVTEEKVTIPPEVMGFISIKASYKLRGLVNVSGFHVDCLLGNGYRIDNEGYAFLRGQVPRTWMVEGPEPSSLPRASTTP